MALITCQNVSMGYEGKIVLSDVNMEVNIGDFLCIVGENGSGKSTLMKGLLNLKQPIKGKILTGDGLVSKEIGYLPQQSGVQKNFPASIYEVVISGRLNQLKWNPFYTAEDKKAADEKMEMLGIMHMKHQSFQELSGGQQQRVLLARALCATKRLLLLDEPTTGLDPVVTNDFYKLVNMINKEYNITIIMISHDVEASLKYATHILQLGNKQVFFGKKEKYLSDEAGKVFLGGSEND